MALRIGWTQALLRWYESSKRDLPWRRTGDPYSVWISEIMLQQTRVEAVIAYYHRFLKAFPTVQALADAQQETVLKVWEGLGYYTRARNMHKAAKMIADTFGGIFPGTYTELRKLPGIGEYTAGAIASIAFGEAVPAIDGNVKRVASRLFGIRENIDQPAVIQSIRNALTDTIPKGRVSAFNQALMELGAMVCIPRTPRCERCPLNRYCDAYAAGDAEFLPMADQKKPPLEVAVAVCLMTYGNSVLVFKRKERLLHGLYVFGLVEEITESSGLLQYWADFGLHIEFEHPLGNARHVFTHRIWNMEILRFSLLEKPNDAFLLEYGALLVDKEQLKALPLPTAMKAAKEAALTIL